MPGVAAEVKSVVTSRSLLGRNPDLISWVNLKVSHCARSRSRSKERRDKQKSTRSKFRSHSKQKAGKETVWKKKLLRLPHLVGR